jgi:lipopolysaccharide transport system permease protein
MKEMIKELIDYRQLLYMLTWRDIKIRYKQSVMGFLWAILMPALIVGAGVIVKLAFAFIAGKSVNFADIASLSVKALPWAFFIGSIRFATSSLTSNSNLVTKIYFPREVFPVSAVLANLFDFAIASTVLVVVFLAAGTGLSVHLCWLPVLLALLLILTVGLSMFLACANLFFRDVKYLVEAVLTFAIFFTPVFYDSGMFGKWATLIRLNPVGDLLEAINAVTVLHHSPDLFWIAYSATWSVVGCLLSWIVFHRLEFMFAEKI